MIHLKLVVAGTVALASVGMLAVPRATLHRDPPGDVSPVPPALGAIAATGAIGLTPEAAAVAGVSVSEVRALALWLAGNPPERVELSAALVAVGDARLALDAASRAAAGSPSNQQLAESVQSRRSQLAVDNSRLETARSAVGSAIDRQLQRPVSATIRSVADTMRLGLPPEFAVANLGSSQANAARLSLRAEARATRMGTTLPTSQAQALSAIRSLPSVIEARQRLDQSLAELRQQFDSSRLQ